MSARNRRGAKNWMRAATCSLFGAVLYEMATGRLPFQGASSAAIFTAHPATSRPGLAVESAVPAELEAIIDKALEKDRDLRYQSAAEMRADLQRLKRDTDSGRSSGTSLRGVLNFHQSAGTRQPAAEAVVSKPVRPRWKGWAIAVGGLGLLVIALLIYLDLALSRHPKYRATSRSRTTASKGPGRYRRCTDFL